MTGAVRIEMADLRLDADLVVAPDAKGLVIFAHGSGSGRAGPRNRMVAESDALEQVAELARDWFVAQCPV